MAAATSDEANSASGNSQATSRGSIIAPQMHIHAMIEAVVCEAHRYGTSKTTERFASSYLILSDHMLYVVDKGEDMLLRVLYIAQIDLFTR